MKPSWRFALLVALFATLLFLAWPAVSTVYRTLAAGIANVIRGAFGAEPVSFVARRTPT